MEEVEEVEKWRGGGRRRKKEGRKKLAEAKSHVMPHEKSMFAIGRPLNG